MFQNLTVFVKHLQKKNRRRLNNFWAVICGVQLVSEIQHLQRKRIFTMVFCLDCLDNTGKKMTFFHDPDGLPLELHE